jgi:AAA family ATP:ADP antiporter
MLEGCTQCVLALHRWSIANHGPAAHARDQAPVGGGVLSGVRVVFKSPFLLGIAAYVLLLTTTSTLLYTEQAQIISKAARSDAARTVLFARIDFVVNAATLVLQAFVTGRLVRRLGVVAGLAILPITAALGFIALAFRPNVLVLTAAQGLRRAVHHGVERPSREILFTQVDREQKYKSKNFIDTVVYRGGDALSSWAGAGLQALGQGPALAAAAVALSALWLWNALYLARHDESSAARTPALEAGTVEAP